MCDGKAMLIDGGNVADSDVVAAVLKKQNISHLDYVVCTHAHEDHVGGLSGALSVCTAGVVYSPVLTFDSKAFSNFEAKVKEQGLSLTIPRQGDTFSLGSAKVTVIGSGKEYEDINDTSIVLRIVYGSTSFMFTGDAGRDAERDMIDSGLELESTVLKVGHHGSSTSSSYVWLRAVNPKYAVISVGEGNDYGHPHEETMSRLRDADVTLYRTDLNGDIIATSDGKTVTFETNKQASDQEKNPSVTNGSGQGSQNTTGKYIGNTNTQKFHSPDCGSLPAEENRVYFDSYEEAIKAGYEPHQSCVK
jgi:competence protein ComEC